jgi:hypothetical protein
VIKRRGHLVMAADESRAEAPNREESRRVYGESANKCGEQAARTNPSASHDAFNRFLLDVETRRRRSGGMEETNTHIEGLEETAWEESAAIMFDRKREPLEFMDFLEQKVARRVVRPRKGGYEAERAGARGGGEEAEPVYTRAWELAEQKSKRAGIIKAGFADGGAAPFMTNLGGGGPRRPIPPKGQGI